MNGELDEEALEENIENRSLGREPLDYSIRLMSIYSIVNGGIPDKIFESLKKDIIETYGYQQTVLFEYLNKLDLLKKQGKKSKKDLSMFEALNKAWELVKPPGKDPSAILKANLPYDAYTPISARIFEQALTNGWANAQLLNLIPGPMKVFGNAQSAVADGEKKVILLYFIGGLTFSEVTCIRKIAEKANIELMIATTDLITPSNTIKPLIDLTKGS